ncbi:hypothetical protein C8R43DRAFT_1123468 [Mycena crocata]|nr:hypothetical protein C8R43DRAFT_1123468 [Mycena crocata]
MADHQPNAFFGKQLPLICVSAQHGKRDTVLLLHNAHSVLRILLPSLRMSADEAALLSMSTNQAALLLQLAADAQVTAYVAAASLTLMVFECLLSLPREVDLVWSRQKSLVKWLYIWNRYFSLVITCFCTAVYVRPTPSNRDSTAQVQGTSATIIVGTVDLILLLRIWILCNRSRRILLCITTLTVNNLNEFVHVGFITGCYSPDVPKYFAIFPAPSFIVSCTMFIVTLRNCRRRIAASRPHDTHPIVKIFLRDGVVWFLVIALINPPQIALWAWGRPSLIQVLMIAYSIIGARVLLNMMEIAAQGGDSTLGCLDQID